LPTHIWLGTGVPERTPRRPANSGIEPGIEVRDVINLASADISEIHIAPGGVLLFRGALSIGPGA